MIVGGYRKTPAGAAPRAPGWGFGGAITHPQISILGYFRACVCKNLLGFWPLAGSSYRSRPHDQAPPFASSDEIGAKPWGQKKNARLSGTLPGSNRRRAADPALDRPWPWEERMYQKLVSRMIGAAMLVTAGAFAA